MRRLLAVFVLGLSVSGCLSTDPPEGVLACSTDAECPSGWACSGSRCRRSPHDAGRSDAQSFDAQVLADAARSDGGPIDGGSIDSGSNDGGAADASAPCAVDFVCEPAAPGGWSGPVVVVTRAGEGASPSCPSNAPSTVFATRSGINAPPAACECLCAPPPAESLACGSATIYSSSSCITIGRSVATLADDTCTTLSLPTTGTWSLNAPPFSARAGASCTAMPATTVPPIDWAASHRGCGFGAPVGCGDARVCAPRRSPEERLCVYVDGEATCPAAFPELLSTAEDATDSRGCSACSCGAVEGRCGGYIDITDGCPGRLLHERINVGACQTASSIPDGWANTSYTPTASCPPSAPTPVGTATLTMIRTVCCAAD